MFFDDDVYKRLDKVEKLARKANQRSALVLILAAGLLGAILACDEITMKRRDEKGV